MPHQPDFQSYVPYTRIPNSVQTVLILNCYSVLSRWRAMSVHLKRNVCEAEQCLLEVLWLSWFQSRTQGSTAHFELYWSRAPRAQPPATQKTPSSADQWSQSLWHSMRLTARDISGARRKTQSWEAQRKWALPGLGTTIRAVWNSTYLPLMLARYLWDCHLSVGSHFLYNQISYIFFLHTPLSCRLVWLQEGGQVPHRAPPLPWLGPSYPKQGLAFTCRWAVSSLSAGSSSTQTLSSSNKQYIARQGNNQDHTASFNSNNTYPKQRNDIVKVWGENNPQSIDVYSEKIFLKNDDKLGVVVNICNPST